MNNITSQMDASNYYKYNVIDSSDNKNLIIQPFDKLKQASIMHDTDYKNRYSDAYLSNVRKALKEEVDNSRGHLNMSFEMIDYLSRPLNTPGH